MTDPTPNAPMPEPLSPAAQSLITAFLDTPLRSFVCSVHRRDQIAAVLRAAAMQTLLTSEHYEGSTPNDYELGWNAAVAYIQNTATELEGQP